MIKKSTLLLILTATIFFSCKKSPNANGPSTPATGLSGKYALYRRADTTYALNSTIIQSITNYTLTGDTAYLNPGTTHYIIQPNPVINYNPVFALADTLQFDNATSGAMLNKTGDYSFTYSLLTGAYDDGSGGGGFTTTLFLINPTTVEMESVQILNNFRYTATGSFYKKQ